MTDLHRPRRRGSDRLEHRLVGVDGRWNLRRQFGGRRRQLGCRRAAATAGRDERLDAVELIETGGRSDDRRPGDAAEIHTAIIIIFLTPVLNSRGMKKLRCAIQKSRPTKIKLE